jgi:sugar/nucleoside kinase (ribokinase family)
MDAIVFGNVALDVICYSVDDVPRRDSLSFEQVAVTPGGCASNVAIGLAALGVSTGLIAHTGDDDTAEMLFRYWERVGLDTRFVQRTPGSTGVSIGLVDRDYQPRFVYTPGANRGLTAAAIDPQTIAAAGVRHFHISGFFVLPNLSALLDEKLSTLRVLGITTSLDVVFNNRMDDPQLRAALWAALPQVDYFMCNDYEAFCLVDERDPALAAQKFRERGARGVIVKLGENGCYLDVDSVPQRIPALKVDVVDTTGAGDAFAAGLVAALSRGADIVQACQAGNQAGARVCTRLGAIEAWLE